MILPGPQSGRLILSGEDFPLFLENQSTGRSGPRYRKCRIMLSRFGAGATITDDAAPEPDETGMQVDALTILLFGLFIKAMLGALFFVFWLNDRRGAVWFAWWSAKFAI